MLAPHNHSFPRQYQMYQSKLITIISPYTGEHFKIELSGEEGEFRELLAALLSIDPSFIKGLKDSFGNYYTISCALKDPLIFANGNNLFSLVLNISNSNYNKYKNYTNSINKNLLYNINNNYHNRTEYNEIYIGNRENKLLDNNYGYKNKNKIRKYSNLIKKLIPAINRNFKEKYDESNSSYLDEWSSGQQVKYQKTLEKLRSNFDKEYMNILRELLKMENITIINYFKIYEKTKDKKDLLKNLKILSKKYYQKLRNKKFTEIEEESEDNISSSHKKEKKTKKSKKKHNKKSSSESEESSIQSSHKAKKKTHHHRKHSSSSENLSDSNSSDEEESDNHEEKEEEEEEEEEESEEKKHNFPIKCKNMTELINAIKEVLEDKIDISCLFTNDIDFIKKTETQKMQLLKDEFNIKDFTLTENSYELIKTYYENILKKVIMKDLTKEEKDLLLKLIKKKNKSIKLRFKALLRHNNYEYLITDIKECLNDKLKKKKNKNQSDSGEHQINIEGRESMSINSNSNNENEGEEDYQMGESTKSIRKNERMAKNNKKNKKEHGSQKSKSKDDDSSGQIKLFQMQDSSADDSETNNNENKKEKENGNKENGDEGNNKEGDFISVINKLKEDGKLDITEKDVNILSTEFKNNTQRVMSVWEIYQNDLEEDDFIESIKLVLNVLKKNGNYNNDNDNNEKNDNNGNNENNNNNDNKSNNNNNNGEEDKPYAKEIISGLKGVKFGKKGNKKIINILLKNKIFTKDEMRNIEEDLDQNNQFVSGAFELLYVTMNVEDFVENLNIKLHLPAEGENGQNANSALPLDDEKYNQIRNNLEIIVKSLSEDDQNKIRELFEKKDIYLLNILESEVNDIEKAKNSILNFLGKN